MPLAEAADNLAGAGADPTFAIGGAAFLKPWFDRYRAEAPNGSITVAAGDSVGATPPISTFFGDTPTIELMNAMGFDADGLGNHNFDKGSGVPAQHARSRWRTSRSCRPTSSTRNGKTPAEWKPSQVFTRSTASRSASSASPTRTRRRSISPGRASIRSTSRDSLAAVNAEAARLEARASTTIVAIGHLGATAGTLTNPTGPLLDLADSVTGRRRGDRRPHRLPGAHARGPTACWSPRTAARASASPGSAWSWTPRTKAVVYKTADFHKPWDIGVTPDPAIQARIDELNAQLAPILGTVIGSSTRGDPARRRVRTTPTAGCASRWSVTSSTDAMRTKYASIGVEFAITNSGGLRADLTCPTADGARRLLPGVHAAAVPDHAREVLAVLPFGNIVVTLTSTAPSSSRS